MRRMMLLYVLIGTYLFAGCGDALVYPSEINPAVLGDGITKTQGELTCRGFPANRGNQAINSSLATWQLQQGGGFSVVPANPSVISWNSATVIRSYTGGQGNFAPTCTFTYELVTFDPGSIPPVTGGVLGCQTALRNTGGQCNWGVGIAPQPVAAKHFFIYVAAAPWSFIEQGWDFKKVNMTGQQYSIDLNLTNQPNGHF